MGNSNTFIAEMSERVMSKAIRGDQQGTQLANSTTSLLSEQSDDQDKQDPEEESENEDEGEAESEDNKCQDSAAEVVRLRCLKYQSPYRLKLDIPTIFSVGGPFALTNVHREEIKAAYDRMPKSQMWKLKSGTIVEEELYRIGQELRFEHAIHSFILDTDDEIIQKHFSNADLEEIIDTPGPIIPDLFDEVAEYLSQFSGKTNLTDIREIMNKSDTRFDKNYVRDLYHDLDYIRFALYAIEIESGQLRGNNFESWYNCHVWHAVIDQRFKRDCCYTLGRRGDWILRSVGNGERDEYGAGEAGKQWADQFGTKFLKEAGLKLPKILKDMLMKLMRKAEWDPVNCAKIQTFGIIHAGEYFIVSGLIMMTIYMDRPCGFVYRVQRGEIMEIPDSDEKFPSVLEILATVLRIKLRLAILGLTFVENSQAVQRFRNLVPTPSHGLQASVRLVAQPCHNFPSVGQVVQRLCPLIPSPSHGLQAPVRRAAPPCHTWPG
ncbi:hypothetical protein BC938DRAFT_480968 [Jimgerdemannia flammicorona]|uniref:Uncharacterized protein n=1 Tax=Jimgerdemannia flammicorona TaxID=994334 RepID=A0A433QX77_9FUNG|nr:hypothetical protein BC938DRAFT_480968 [Jimgerdemannia flammicorona]